MKCDYCGEEISNNARFCSSCGKGTGHSDEVKNDVVPEQTNGSIKDVAAIVKPSTTTENHSNLGHASPTKNTKRTVYLMIFGVAILALVLLGSWANEEWQFRKYVSNHDYKSLETIITKPDTSMSKKERAIEAIIQAGDNDAASAIETLLASNKLQAEAEKIVWKTLAKYKLSLPSGMAILAKGKNYANTPEIQQYYSAVMPIEQEISSIKQISCSLINVDNSKELNTFFTNVRDIINTMPENDRVVFSKVKTNIDAWVESLQKKEEAASKIQAAQAKVNASESIINNRMNKIHTLVMDVYQVRNTPISAAYMDSDMKSAYVASFKQTDSTVRAMTNDLSGGDPTKRALVYLDIAMRFGDPEVNKQVASWGGEISEQAKELAKSREEYNKIQTEYDLGRLNRNVLRLKQSMLDLVVGRNPVSHVVALPQNGVIGIPSTTNAGYLTYKNSRFGFSIDYPNNFIPGKPPANGDGQSFTSSDGQATLSISGGNISGRTIRDLYDSAIKNINGELGYNTLKENWFVVTWKQGGKIYYKKMFVGTGSHNGFTFGYPESQKEQYDNIVTTIERSFSQGDTDWPK